eukprot:scaffold1658_cov60-Phaeocystis_antarctica.AAC.2
MIDVLLGQPASILHEDVSKRSGYSPECFSLYHQSKPLEGEATLASLGVQRNAVIELKTRGRGGVKDIEIGTAFSPPPPAASFIPPNPLYSQPIRLAAGGTTYSVSMNNHMHLTAVEFPTTPVWAFSALKLADEWKQCETIMIEALDPVIVQVLSFLPAGLASPHFVPLIRRVIPGEPISNLLTINPLGVLNFLVVNWLPLINQCTITHFGPLTRQDDLYRRVVIRAYEEYENEQREKRQAEQKEKDSKLTEYNNLEYPALTSAKKVLEDATVAYHESAIKVVSKVGVMATKEGAVIVLKKVPVLGLLLGIGFGIYRAAHNDWTGASLEVLSGVASLEPGAGTVISAGLDLTLLEMDMVNAHKDAEETLSKAVEKVHEARTQLEGIEVKIDSYTSNIEEARDVIAKLRAQELLDVRHDAIRHMHVEAPDTEEELTEHIRAFHETTEQFPFDTLSAHFIVENLIFNATSKFTAAAAPKITDAAAVTRCLVAAGYLTQPISLVIDALHHEEEKRNRLLSSVKIDSVDASDRAHKAFWLKNVHDGRALCTLHNSDDRAHKGNQEKAIIYDYYGNATQHWKVVDEGGGRFSLRNEHDNRALCTLHNSEDRAHKGNQEEAIIYDYYGNATQLWELVFKTDSVDASDRAHTGRAFWLKNVHDGRALCTLHNSDDRAHKGNQEKAIIYDYYGNATQHWKLVDEGGGRFSLKNVHDNRALCTLHNSDDRAHKGNQEEAIIFDYYGNATQHWKLVDEGGGRFSLRNEHDNRALCTLHNSEDRAHKGNQEEAIIYDYYGNATQLWELVFLESHE